MTIVTLTMSLTLDCCYSCRSALLRVRTLLLQTAVRRGCGAKGWERKHACMMGLEALISSVFFDAMYDDIVLSRRACTKPDTLSEARSCSAA